MQEFLQFLSYSMYTLWKMFDNFVAKSPIFREINAFCVIFVKFMHFRWNKTKSYVKLTKKYNFINLTEVCYMLSGWHWFLASIFSLGKNLTLWSLLNLCITWKLFRICICICVFQLTLQAGKLLQNTKCLIHP